MVAVVHTKSKFTSPLRIGELGKIEHSIKKEILDFGSKLYFQKEDIYNNLVSKVKEKRQL